MSIIPSPACNDKDEWIARIALSLFFEHQTANVHKLINCLANAQAVFQSSQKEIETIIGKKITKNIRDNSLFDKAKEEFKTAQENHIELCYCGENNYPTYLLQCEDRPILLYKKGEKDIAFRRMLAIVGTRKCSEYGKKVVRDIVEQLRVYNPVIVSGLAYGIDAVAHEMALANRLKTVAILGNGLGKIYPSTHYALAKNITHNGAIYAEYTFYKQPDRFHFPMRNRIIAGMCVGTLVVETDVQGGAMITASLACNYNREVMCIPHSIYAGNTSAGCHQLIKKNMAILVENGDDIAAILGWENIPTQSNAHTQTSLNKELLSEKSRAIISILEQQESVHIDTLMEESNMEQNIIALNLLELEMQGIIKKRPGNFFSIA